MENLQPSSGKGSLDIHTETRAEWRKRVLPLPSRLIFRGFVWDIRIFDQTTQYFLISRTIENIVVSHIKFLHYI